MSPEESWRRRWAPGAFAARRTDQPRCVRRDDAARLAYAPQVGEARFPVLHSSKGVEGLLLPISVRGEEPLAEPLVARLRAEAARLAGREDPGPLPERLYLHKPPDLVVEGQSLDLAGLVALLSALLGRQPAAGLCFSARVDGGALGAVDGLETKARVVATEAPGSRLIGPDAALQQALDLALGPGWSAELHSALGVSHTARDREALEEALARRWSSVGRLARAGSLADRWRQGVFASHKGLPEAAAHLQAARLLVGEADPAWLDAELVAFLAGARLDQGATEEARALAQEALQQLEQSPHRDRRWRQVATQVSGTLRRILHAAGDLDRAIALQEAWGLHQAALPEEEARCRLDLAHLRRSQGDAAAAQQSLMRARAALPEARDADRPSTARFLALQESRLGLRPLQRPRLEAFPTGFLDAAEQAELRIADGSAEAFWGWLPLRPADGFDLALATLLGEGVERLGPPPDLEQRRAALSLTPLHAAALGGPGWRRVAPY